MKYSDQIIEMFNKAISNPENLDTECVDGINWGFVDADINMDLADAGIELEPNNLMDFIDDLIKEYIGEEV